MEELAHTGPGLEMPYLEFAPDSGLNSQKVIVYLHGSGERGSDLSRVKRHGLPSLLANRSATSNTRVICPQLESGNEWQPQRIFGFVQALRVNRAQLLLAGYSLGGAAVCLALAQYGAQLCQLGMSIAGRCDSARMVPQGGVNFLSVRGEFDVQHTAGTFVEAVRELGGTAREVVLPGEGHFIAEQSLWHADVQSFLLAAGIHILPSTVQDAADQLNHRV
jgi:pimeloyl-ACP methyl ester carboxylesterase